MSHDLRAVDWASDLSNGPAPTSADPLAAARARGEQAKRDILAGQGDMLDTEAVAARLRTTLADIETRRERGLLLALPLDDGTWAFPTWQFADHALLPGLEVVLEELPVSVGPWSRVQFFESGDPYLKAQTPLSLICRGDIEPVRRLAAAYDELVAT